MILSDLFSDALIYAVGWTIVHTLWQGALVAIVLAVVLACTRAVTPNTRYLLSATGLLLIAGMAVPTFISLYTPEAAQKPAIFPLMAYAQPVDGAGMPVDVVEAATAPGDFAADLRSWLDAGMPAIVLVWFAGMLFLTVKFLAEFAYTNRLRYKEIFPPSPFWKSRFEDLCYLTNVRKGIDLVESALVQVPIVIGVLKPVILLPLGTLAGLPAQQIEAILAHELAHIRRHDYLVNILQTLITILFFYHPAIWWISSRMRIEREHCCDDIAVAVSGSPIALAKALAGLQERALAPRSAMAATGGGNKYHLLHRIRRIAGQPGKSSTPVERGVAVCVLVAALLVVGFNAHASFAEDKEQTTIPEDSTATQTPLPTQTSLHSSESVQSAVAELPDSYKISVILNIGPNGTPQRVDAVIGKRGNRGEIRELFIDGKKIPPSEFGKYEKLLSDAKQSHDAALEAEEAEVMAEEAEVMAEEAEAMAEEAEVMAEAMAEEAEAMAKEIEQQTEELVKEIEKQAEALSKEAEAWAKQSGKNPQLDSALQLYIKEFQKSVNELSKQTVPTDMESYRKYMEQYQKSMATLSQQLAGTAQQMSRDAQQRERELKKNADSLRVAHKQLQKQHKAMSELIEKELLKDKLIANTNRYEFKMTDSELVVDGKTQPHSVLEKYKKLLTAKKYFEPGAIINLQKSNPK